MIKLKFKAKIKPHGTSYHVIIPSQIVNNCLTPFKEYTFFIEDNQADDPKGDDN